VRSQFPIIIHWGWPDLVVLYNDAFIPMIGTKHPGALGTRLFDSWPELRPTIEGMLETVLTAGKAALAENLLHVYDRHGYLEERYFTVSFNPIMLDSGEPGGSFTFIHNITDKVIGERRLRTLRDLAARAAHTATRSQHNSFRTKLTCSQILLCNQHVHGVGCRGVCI
jgi:hypothetical protein